MIVIWILRIINPMIKELKPNRLYNNLTLRERTPNGTAFIIITEDGPGEIIRIDFQIGKTGSEVRAYNYAISELATALLARGMSIEELIRMLLDITSDRAGRFGAGENRSGVEALANALRKYLQSIDPKIRISL